jgi:hypothetical protein
MIFYSPALTRRECLPRCLVGSLPAENAPQVLTDLGAGDRSQCEGARGFASAQIYGKTEIPRVRLARGTAGLFWIDVFLLNVTSYRLEWNQSMYVCTFM